MNAPDVDRVIERKLREALLVEPTNDFQTRVRTELRGRRQAIRSGRAWWLASAAVATAAVVVFALAVRSPRSRPADTSNPQLASASAPEAVGASIDSPPAPLAALLGPLPAPAVVQTPDERRGLEDVVALAQRGDEIVEALFKPSNNLDLDLYNSAVALEPVVIEPLTIEQLYPESY